MTETYKGHHIQVLAWRVAERNGWRPLVHVTDYTAPNKVDVKRLPFGRIYATQREVQLVGFLAAKNWIDNGKPELGNGFDAGQIAIDSLTS
jgi:hypothetical protein